MSELKAFDEFSTTQISRFPHVIHNKIINKLTNPLFLKTIT